LHSSQLIHDIAPGLITAAIIAHHRAGVPVRVIMEPRRNTNPLNAAMIGRMRAAGVGSGHRARDDFRTCGRPNILFGGWDRK